MIYNQYKTYIQIILINHIKLINDWIHNVFIVLYVSTALLMKTNDSILNKKYLKLALTFQNQLNIKNPISCNKINKQPYYNNPFLNLFT